jgi:hypothetical protein
MTGDPVAVADRLASKAPRTIRVSQIKAESIEWLDPGRVPFAMTTVLAGFPGVGKSTLLYDLAARTSREGQAVIILTAEDHLAAVVRPRLEAARAELDLVHVVTSEVTLPESVPMLGELVEEHGARLVTIDPLLAFIGDGSNTHRDHHTRRVLAPIAALAERTGAAVPLVLHTNKGLDSEPLLRIGGSIGFTGAARSVLIAADDPHDEGRRILAVAKSNLAAFPAPLAYTLEPVTLRGGVETSRVRWLGEAPEVNVRELLARGDPEDRSAREEALEHLRDSGVLEMARPAGQMYEGAKAAGIDAKALQRARRSLGIRAWKEGYPGLWMWGPPESDTTTLSGSSESPLPAGMDGPQAEPDTRLDG